MVQKACPVIIRNSNGVTELLAFRHPSAGKQLVKGTIDEGEAPADAAIRELREESGISIDSGLIELGEAKIGATIWHFFAATVDCALECWNHQTTDECGHVFEFFWHPISQDLDAEWHPQFHEALAVIRRSAGRG